MLQDLERFRCKTSPDDAAEFRRDEHRQDRVFTRVPWSR